MVTPHVIELARHTAHRRDAVTEPLLRRDVTRPKRTPAQAVALSPVTPAIPSIASAR